MPGWAETYPRLWQLWQSWLLRWILSCIIGWGLGFVVAALLLRWLGLPAAFVAGMIVAGIAALLQAWAIKPIVPGLRLRGWVGWSALAGLCATLPVYGLGLVLLLNPYLGLLLMGAAFGATLGYFQGRLLPTPVARGFWLGACMMGAALCAPLSLLPLSGALPIWCSPGLPVFALLTALALRRIAPDKIELFYSFHEKRVIDE